MPTGYIIITKLNSIIEISKKYPTKSLNVSLYSLLFYKDLYYLAFNNLKFKRMTLVSWLDEAIRINSFSDATIISIIGSLKNESFKFKPPLAVNRPNLKGKGGFRTLFIACQRDKIIQEVIRIILEIVFKPIFTADIYGFRKKPGYHSALLRIRKEFQVVRWIIKCDIVKFFGKIEHTILMNIIKNRIKDQRMLNLIYKFLNAGYAFNSITARHDVVEVLQWDALSPLLYDIFLSKLDRFIGQDQKTTNKGIKQIVITPEYSNPPTNKHLVITTNNYNNIVKSNNLVLEPCYPFYIDHPNFRRLLYVRYAADFIIGFRGPFSEAKFVAKSIENFLQDTLMLKFETKIYNLSQNGVKFLGAIIKFSSEFKIKFINKHPNVSNNSQIVKQCFNKRLLLTVPITDIKNKLIKLGFLNSRSSPIPKLIWISSPLNEIIRLYNSVINNFLNYYSFANNMGQLVRFFWYVMQLSCAKLLANKLKLKTSKVFKKLGNPIRITKYNVLFAPLY